MAMKTKSFAEANAVKNVENHEPGSLEFEDESLTCSESYIDQIRNKK